MPRITITYELAMAAARDLANRRAAKAGRKAWDETDYNAAVDEFNRLYPLETHLEWASTGK